MKNVEFKEYKNEKEIINILRDRGMLFKYPIKAEKILNNHNYFFLKGYNKLYLKDETNYKDNVDFEDLYDLYKLDKNIKTLIFRYLLDIEQKLKTNLTNHISNKYGVAESEYLKKDNYDLKNPYVEETLMKIKEQKRVYGEKNEAVKYYLDKYNYVPLWVLSKSLTMGATRNLFFILKPDEQDRISKNMLTKDIKHKRVVKLKNIIALLTDVRNMCAHDEILLCYRHRRIHLSELPEHSYFNFKRNKDGDLKEGDSDLFAIILSIKYLTNRSNYNSFINSLDTLIKKFLKKHPNVKKQELLDYMNLPLNYVQLKNL